MPELTTGEPGAVAQARTVIARAEAKASASGLMHVGFAVVRDLLAAYDEAVAEVAYHEEVLEERNLTVTKFEARAQRAEARAAAAEAAVQRVAQETCRECRDEGEWLASVPPADFVLWGKLLPAEALGPRCYDHAAKWLGRGMEQIEQHAVLDLRPLRAVLSTANVPQSDLTSVSGIVNAAPDDQPVTVTGYIHHVSARHNQAGTPYVTLVLVDRNAEIEDRDPDYVKVAIPPATYAAMDLALIPREGALVEVTGRTVREVQVNASDVRELTCPGHLGSDPEDPEYCDGTCRSVGSQP